MRILTRYVLRSLVGPFVFSLSAITLLMLLNELGRRFGRLLGKGLDAGVIVEVFALSLPFILAMTLPMAVLAAVLYTFNRMASDNEITALKASGTHLPRLLVPVVAAATVLALGMVWFNNTVLPDSNHRLQVLLSSISRKKPTFVLKERTINEVLDGELYIQVARVDRATNELADVVIYDQRVPDQSRVIYADSGKMALSQDGTDLYLTLRHGHTEEEKAEEPDALQRIQFRSMVMRVPDVSNRLRREEMGGYRGDREMTIPQLRAEVEQGRERASSVELESRTYAVALTRRLLGLATDDPEELEDRLLRRRPAATTAGRDPGAGRRAGETSLARAGREGAGVGAGDEAGGRPAGGDDRVDRGPAVPPGAAGDSELAERIRRARERMRSGSLGRRIELPEAGDRPRGFGSDTTDGGGPGTGRTAAAAADTGAGAARTEGPEPPVPPDRTEGRTRTREQAERGRPARVRAGTAAGSAAAGPTRLDTLSAEARVQGLERALRVGSSATPPANFTSLSRRRGTALSQSNRYAVEIHKKYSIPAACIVFVLIGGPLAVRYREAGMAMVVAASLLIFCAYYVSLVGGEELADELILSPFWAMWAPNVLFGGVGLGLLWRSVEVG